MFWNANIWHALEDLIFHGQWTNLHDRLRNGPKLVTSDYLVWFLHPSHMWIQTAFSCGKHCQTMQIGTVSRLRLCRSSWGLKINFWRNIVRFWKSYICSNKLDVQETNCRTENPHWFVGSDRRSSWKHDSETYWTGRSVYEPKWGSSNTSHNSKTKEISWSDQWSGQCWFYFLKRQFFSSGSVVCVWRQRSSDQDDHKGKKPDNETWFQDPQSCSWMVVR